MNSSRTTCGDAPGFSQISQRTPRHIQEFGNNIGKIIRGLRKGKKNQSHQLFVPAGPLPRIPTDEHGPPLPQRPPPPRLPPNIRSISHDCSNMLLSVAPLDSSHRRISAPQLCGYPNSECARIRPSLSTASGMEMLHVNTDGHGETAGSGMDYVSQLPSSVTFNSSVVGEQLIKEKAFERLVEIRSVIDEKNRILGIINGDIEKLQLFMTQRLSETGDAADCKGEQLKRKLSELHDEVTEIEAELAKLRHDSPKFVPPPVPTRPMNVRLATKWNCLRCTFCNKAYTFRCENCMLPSLRIDPRESEMCQCSVCGGSVQSMDSSNCGLASPVQHY
ncbi:unnamed protein product [Toxocara canis]|uniref:RanBP2-type domain-containing protein n=1 Tax=Toxocara canis TaxID=6265 RepID=A0A183V608_TOXCA|nr:unnamed protein product [Toxocara canis]